MEDQASGRRHRAGHDGQAHRRHPNGHRPAQRHHPTVQADPAGDDPAKAQQSGEIEHIRADNHPGSHAQLMVGNRSSSGGDLRRVGRQRSNHAEQRLRKSQALADPLQPGHEHEAGDQADQRPGQEGLPRNKPGMWCQSSRHDQADRAAPCPFRV